MLSAHFPTPIDESLAGDGISGSERDFRDGGGGLAQAHDIAGDSGRFDVGNGKPGMPASAMPLRIRLRGATWLAAVRR